MLLLRGYLLTIKLERAGIFVRHANTRPQFSLSLIVHRIIQQARRCSVNPGRFRGRCGSSIKRGSNIISRRNQHRLLPTDSTRCLLPVVPRVAVGTRGSGMSAPGAWGLSITANLPRATLLAGQSHSGLAFDSPRSRAPR